MANDPVSGDDSFDPAVQGGGGQNWLGYSKGTVPNTSKAVGIEYAGNLIEASAKATDRYIELRADHEIRAAVESTQGETTQRYMDQLGYAGLGAGQGTPEGFLDSATPDEIVREATRMESLKNAVSQGSIKDSYYWMQLDTSAKYMKNKYPGHKNFVDETFSKLVGARPANRVIAELQEEYKKGGSPEKKAYDTLVKDMSNDKYNYLGTGGLPADFQMRASQGNPYSMPELLEHRSIMTRNDSAIQADHHRISFASAKGTLTKEDAERSAMKQLGNTMAVLQTSMTAGFKGDFNEMSRKAKEMGDKPFSSEDDLKIRQMLSQQRAQWVSNVNEVLNGSQKGSPGLPDWRYSDYLSPEQMTKVRTQYEKQFDDMTSYLTNKDYGALNLLSRHLKNVQEGVELDAYRSSHVLAALGAVHKVAGKDFLAAIAAEDPAMKTNIANWNKIMLAQLRLPMVGSDGKPTTLPGGPPPRSFNEIYDRVRQADTGRDGGYAFFLNRGVSIMADPKSDKDTFKSFAEGMYGEQNKGFLDRITKDQRGEVLLKIAGNPQIMGRLQKEEPDLYRKYQTWVEGSLQGVLRDHTSTINDARSNPDVDIRYNPNTNSFSAVSRSGKQVDAALQNSIKNVNAAVQGVKPMYSADGRDITQSLDRFVKGLSVTVGAKKEGTADALKREALADDPLGLRGTPRALPVPTVRTAAPLLDLISSGETGGGLNSYQVVYGGKDKKTMLLPDLTNMNLEQISEYQTLMKSQDRGSTAVGKYQFLQGTLKEAAQRLGLDPRKTIFDEQTQDMLAFEQMRYRGLDKYLSGQIKRSDFMKELSKEWAALPQDETGKGYHDDDKMGNKARVKAEALIKTLDTMRPKGIKDPEDLPNAVRYKGVR